VSCNADYYQVNFTLINDRCDKLNEVHVIQVPACFCVPCLKMCCRATSNDELYGLFVCYLECWRAVDNHRKTCEYSTLVSLRSSLVDRREL